MYTYASSDVIMPFFMNAVVYSLLILVNVFNIDERGMDS